MLTDPPWGVTQNKWDRPLDLRLFWLVVERALKPNGTLVVFGDFVLIAAMAQRATVFPFRYDLVWEKNKPRGHLNAKRRPLRTHETIGVFGSADYSPQMSRGHRPTPFAVNHLGSAYGKGRPTMSRVGATDRYPRSVIPWPVVNNDDPERIHSSQKPVDLLRYLIRLYLRRRGRVFDPFAGSAAGLIAAVQEGHDAVGYEADGSTHRKATRALGRAMRSA